MTDDVHKNASADEYADCVLTHTHTPSVPTDLPGHGQALRVGNGRKLFVSQPFDGILVVPQVQFGAHQDDGCVRAVMTNLWIPLQ